MTLSPADALLTDTAELAETRVRFLTAAPFESGVVRDAILASWWRSRHSKVAADHIELQHHRDPDLDTPLTRSAEPVLRHLHEELDGQSVSIVLTDAAGVVLSRLTSDAALEKHLDRVLLVPGYSYAEQFVGTNGIGTALEAGQCMHVFGHEHYAENLEDLACAAVPIRHPVSGKTVGAVDLTCWRRDAGPLLVTLAKTTAEQIRQTLLTETGMREIDLLHAYLRACGRSSGMVFALNNDVVMMNETARRTLTPVDQAALLRHASEGLSARPEVATVDLPTGVRVRMHTRLVRSSGGIARGRRGREGGRAGGPRPGAERAAARHAAPRSRRHRHPVAPGVHEVETTLRSGSGLLLAGEEGVGKLALVRAVHQRLRPSHHFAVLDGAEAKDGRWATEARRTLAEGTGTTVLRHLDRLDRATRRMLVGAAQDGARSQDAWLVATVRPGDADDDELQGLLRTLPSTVEVPPLRHHVEDAQQLVPFLLGRLGHAGQLTCSPEAMQLLQRSSWPGNVAQLLQVLRQVVQVRRTGVIQAGDLPPGTGTLSRRRLSPLESMERDAIARGLLDAGGNKAQAARALGMSRATIYRKVHDYGISEPAELRRGAHGHDRAAGRSRA